MVTFAPQKAYGRYAGFNRRNRCPILTFGVLCVILVPIFTVFALNFIVYRDALNDFENIDALDDYIYETFKASRPKKTEEPQKLVCYYNYPPKNKSERLLPQNLDYDLCTHLNIGFAEVINKTIAMNEDLSSAIVDIVNLKKGSKLKVLLSIGGGSSSGGFSDMVQDHASRKIFIGSIRDTLKRFKLDGIDLDWEFPAIGDLSKKNRERQHFSQLLREIRVEYYREKRDYLLTLAVAAVENFIDVSYDVGEIDQYVDFVNLMTYDFNFYSKITPMTGFNAPLFGRIEDGTFLSKRNINNSICYWLDRGLDRKKLVVGLPTYGHSFNLVNGQNGLPGSPANGYGHVGSWGFTDFVDVCKFIADNADVSISFDEETLSPYLHLNSEWISYDNEQSLSSKVKYIRNLNLGGVMIFSLNSDDFSGTCLNSTSFFLTRHVNNALYNKEVNLSN